MFHLQNSNFVTTGVEYLMNVSRACLPSVESRGQVSALEIFVAPTRLLIIIILDDPNFVPFASSAYVLLYA